MKKKTFDEVQERSGTEAAGELCVVLRWRVKKKHRNFHLNSGFFKGGGKSPHTHESLKPGINNNNNNLL